MLITTEKYRTMVEFNGLNDGSGYLRIRHDATGQKESTILTPKEIRKLIDAMEPFAEKPKTTLELFDEMPLGTHFTTPTRPGVEYVKITDTYYVVIGGMGVIHDVSKLRPDTVLEVKK